MNSKDDIVSRIRWRYREKIQCYDISLGGALVGMVPKDKFKCPKKGEEL